MLQIYWKLLALSLWFAILHFRQHKDTHQHQGRNVPVRIRYTDTPVVETIAEVQPGVSDETGYKSNVQIEIYIYIYVSCSKWVVAFILQ